MATNITFLTGSQWAEQDTTSKVAYTRDWSDFATAADAIATSAWAAITGVTFSGEGFSTVQTAVDVAAATPGLYRISNTVTTASGRRDTRVFLLYVVASSVVVRSDLFARDEFLAHFRSDRMGSVQKYLPANLSDDYLWTKLKAAEAAARRALHVFFVPTVLFPNEPTQAEIDALAGAPWAVDPGYDMDQDLTQPGGWTFVVLRQRPVISLESIKFSYPGMGTVFTVPSNWTKVDKKYGHVRFIPTSNAFTTPMGGMMVGAMGMQSAPQFIEIRYTAGLKDAATDYPDLLDVVQRMVLAALMHDATLPSSTSISADGLSQSSSPPDLEKFKDGIEQALEDLRQRIHGVPFIVL